MKIVFLGKEQKNGDGLTERESDFNGGNGMKESTAQG